MSNQTFYFIIILGIGLFAGFIIYLCRSISAKSKNVELANKLSAAENRNLALMEELSLYNRLPQRF